MALYFKIENNQIVFFGDTFNHRPTIKALGARFNGQDKTWVMTDSPAARDQAAQIARPQGLKWPAGTHNGSESTEPPESVSVPVAAPSRKPSPTSIDIDPSMGLTIAQLMMEADRMISQGFPTPIWVVGEIQSLSRRGAGTLYFDFADAKSGAHQTATMTVKCNLWQNNLTWLEKRHGKDKVAEVFADGNRLGLSFTSNCTKTEAKSA